MSDPLAAPQLLLQSPNTHCAGCRLLLQGWGEVSMCMIELPANPCSNKETQVIQFNHVMLVFHDA